MVKESLKFIFPDLDYYLTHWGYISSLVATLPQKLNQ